MAILLNPYVAGNPVGDSPAFIGRADVLREVLRVLRRPQDNAIVLYGQRRIGKTSILQHLVAWLPREGPYHPVYFDLQYKAAWPLGRVLQELAHTIACTLGQPDPDLDPDPETAFHQEWLPTVLGDLPDGSSLVLLFDEFDVLADPKAEQAAATFFPYLRGLLASDPERLQFVFVIGRNVVDLATIILSLFKGTPAWRVSLLNQEDTSDLVRLSEANSTLHWPDEAVERVWQLTCGHPFLTQQLCSYIWERAYDEKPDEPPAITPADVDAAVPDALEASRHAMEWLWDGLPPAERVVASALAEAGPGPITQEELERLLHESGVRVVIRELQNAPQLLQEWDLIEPADGGYRFRVELLRRWMAEHKPLHIVQKEIEHIEPVAESLYQAALGLYEGGQLDQAIALLRQATALNPNHMRASQLLADILLAQGQSDEARQLLERLYEYQPAATRPRLVQALLYQAQAVKSYDEQLVLYKRVLDLEPMQQEAVTKVAEIKQAMRHHDLAALLQELEALEQKRRYQDALDLAHKAADKYPEMRDWMPDLERLERKTHLADLYRRGLGALQSGDRQTARTLLAQVAALEPGYEEVARYLRLSMIYPLSPWNPVDYLRLLWWVLVTPQRLEAHREAFGEEDERRAGRWLASTLTWLPFFIPTLALGIGTLPYAEEAALSTACLWISLGLALAWVLTGWQGESDDDFAAAMAAVVPGVVAFTVIGFVIFIMINVAARALASDMEVSVAGTTAGCVVISVAFIVAGIAASSVAHAMASRVVTAVAAAVAFVVVFTGAFVVVLVVAFIVAFPVALVVTDLVAGGIALVVADLVAIVTRGMTVGMTGDAPVIAAGIIAFAVAAVVAFNLAIDKLAAIVADVGTMAAVGISLLAHAFLIWFSFLGGWRVFQ